MLNHIVQTTTHHLKVKCVNYYIYKSQIHTIILLHPHSFLVWYRTTTFTKVKPSHSTPLLCRPYYLIDPSWNSTLLGIPLTTILDTKCNNPPFLTQIFFCLTAQIPRAKNDGSLSYDIQKTKYAN